MAEIIRTRPRVKETDPPSELHPLFLFTLQISKSVSSSVPHSFSFTESLSRPAHYNMDL